MHIKYALFNVVQLDQIVINELKKYVYINKSAQLSIMKS